MSLTTTFLIAIGLAMDAFAVSVSSGLTMKNLRIRYALRIALFFGLFQAIMPILGYLAGLSIRDLIASFDHWIVFCLLAYVGGKMIYEAFALDGDERATDPDDIVRLFVLAVATSIDALAVGFSISLLGVAVLVPAAIIGAITFLLSFAGVYLGEKVGHLFEEKVEILGGIILIGIGFKILIEHLWG